MFPQPQDFTWSGVTVGNVFRRPKASVLFVFDGDLEGSGLNAQASVTYQVCSSTVHLYPCICIILCVYSTYLYMYVCTYVCTCICMYKCTYVHTCVRMYVFTVPVYVCTLYVCVCVPVYVYTYVRTL